MAKETHNSETRVVRQNGMQLPTGIFLGCGRASGARAAYARTHARRELIRGGGRRREEDARLGTGQHRNRNVVLFQENVASSLPSQCRRGVGEGGINTTAIRFVMCKTHTPSWVHESVVDHEVPRHGFGSSEPLHGSNKFNNTCPTAPSPGG